MVVFSVNSIRLLLFLLVVAVITNCTFYFMGTFGVINNNPVN